MKTEQPPEQQMMGFNFTEFMPGMLMQMQYPGLFTGLPDTRTGFPLLMTTNPTLEAPQTLKKTSLDLSSNLLAPMAPVLRTIVPGPPDGAPFGQVPPGILPGSMVNMQMMQQPDTELTTEQKNGFSSKLL